MIIPDAKALAAVTVDLVGVMDIALAQPLAIQYLYCGGCERGVLERL